MKILVLNSGSSSIKFKIYNFPQKVPILEGYVERIKQESSYLHIKTDNKKIDINLGRLDHSEALNSIYERLISLNIDNISAVGHRVVHGGEDFKDAVIIDQEVIYKIKSNIPLAPLHNRANLDGIIASREIMPNTPQVAVFDTAFHQTINKSRYIYALPIEFYEDNQVRRYGFHGTSNSYLSKMGAKICNIDIDKFNAISLHLGNGASVCAIKNGKSFDTSMGMTPLEGLVMGTRSGDIDPAIIFYLMRQRGYSSKEIEDILNRRSGLKGLANTNDMREIEQMMLDGNSDAKLAFDIFIERIVKYIGGYFLTLSQVDAIIFSGGIGEHSKLVREAISKRLEPLGVKFDDRLNSNLTSDNFAFHTKDSIISLLKIKTDEELEIAQLTYNLIS